MWSVLLVIVPAALVVYATWTVATLSRNPSTLALDSAASLGDQAARVIDAYVAHLARELRALANMPDVKACARGESRPTTAAAGPFCGESQLRGEARLAEIKRNSVSGYFALLTGSKTGVYRELLLTDKRGGLVAASTAEDIEQADEAWWQEAVTRHSSCDVPQECAYAGDVKFDNSVGGSGFELSVAVFDRGLSTGALKAVVDAREIAALLSLAAARHAIEARLIKRDGSDVFARVGTTKLALSAVDAARLQSLEPGQQVTLTLDDATVPVRALAGPHGAFWAVMVRNSATTAQPRLQVIATLVIAWVMFLLCARTYAVHFGRSR